MVTFINVFNVAPERQQELIEQIQQAAETVMRRLDGFVSASVHQSLDGKKVINYLQWESQEALERSLGDPAAQEQRAAVASIASSFELALCTVASVHTADAG